MRQVIHFAAVYVLWLRELKKLFRSTSRIIGSLMTPLLFLIFLGFGLKDMALPGTPAGTTYTVFLVPGIIGMGLLFSSTFAGLSLLMDREFGFLKEIMVAPVNRISIVIGRILGGTTTGLLQAVLILLISLIFGMRIPSVLSFFIAIVFMILIAVAFIGMGLVFAANMRDTHGFNLIVNFVIFPLFFLSGAMYSINNLPTWLRTLSYLDPLTYGVDGMRGALLGISTFPLPMDFFVLLFFSLIMVKLGAYFFERVESA